jgi:hypothetical protein
MKTLKETLKDNSYGQLKNYSQRLLLKTLTVTLTELS